MQILERQVAIYRIYLQIIHIQINSQVTYTAIDEVYKSVDAMTYTITVLLLEAVI